MLQDEYMMAKARRPVIYFGTGTARMPGMALKAIALQNATSIIRGFGWRTAAINPKFAATNNIRNATAVLEKTLKRTNAGCSFNHSSILDFKTDSYAGDIYAVPGAAASTASIAT